MTFFKEEKPTIESYWRSIILFGENTASYKFALAKSLLNLIPSGKQDISITELAPLFAYSICEHIKRAPKQTVNPSSTFLTACRDYNNQIITYDELVDITIKNAFRYVFDAFHIVNEKEVHQKFFEKDKQKIILTDNLYRLNELKFATDLNAETEARWNLVETAWNVNISPRLLTVNYDDFNSIFYIGDQFKRKEITSARDALNGYQRGKCFYCFDDITINVKHTLLCDVDHFFPHTLQSLIPNVNLDGVWNLVLTCKSCNRGENGKFAQIPAIKYLERLHKRNEYLINSHHPLRETLMNQTGRTEEDRRNFLNKMDAFAINNLIHRWEIKTDKQEVF